MRAYLNNSRISLNYPRQFEVGRSVLFPSCCKICHITWDPSHHASKLVLGSRHRLSLLHHLFSHLSPWNVSSLSTVTLQPCDLRRFKNFYSTVHYIGMKFIINIEIPYIWGSCEGIKISLNLFSMISFKKDFVIMCKEFCVENNSRSLLFYTPAYIYFMITWP